MTDVWKEEFGESRRFELGRHPTYAIPITVSGEKQGVVNVRERRPVDSGRGATMPEDGRPGPSLSPPEYSIMTHRLLLLATPPGPAEPEAAHAPMGAIGEPVARGIARR